MTAHRAGAAHRWSTCFRVVPLCAWLLVAAPTRAAVQQPPDGLARLLQRLEQIVLAGDPSRYLELVESQGVDLAAARAFAQANIFAGAGRAVVRERDRVELAGHPSGTAYRLAVDVFSESGHRGRLSTWRVDVVRKPPGEDGVANWAITAQRSLSSFGALYRLSLAPRQFAAKGLVITAEDLELRLPQGSVFTAETDAGTTVLVLIGSGRVVFRPSPATEREQMRLFSGSDAVDSAFTTAFIRLAPSSLYSHIAGGTLEEQPVDPQTQKVAQEIFRQDNPKSFGLNLGDLAADNWSLVPGTADFLAEIHTRRFKTLTYTKSSREAEDISLFDRAERFNISLYSSRQKLAERGRFYDDDELEDYEVLHYDIDASIDPMRQAVEGVARLTVRTRSATVNALTLRLAETLDVQSASSPQLGRLVTLRIRNQHSVVVNLPESVPEGTVMRLTIAYRGRVAPQFIDREAIALENPVAQDQEGDEVMPAVLEPSYLYSNRSYWYPQAGTSGFATAVMRVRVPPTFRCAGSGDPEPVQESAGPGKTSTAPFVFRAIQPVRYLSVLITRLLPVRSANVGVKLDAGETPHALSGVYYRNMGLHALASPRMRTRTLPISERAIDVLRFYSSLMADCPYPSLTLAVVERQLPGGHSPGFLAVLAQPVLGTPYNWSSDPTSFNDFPEFFLAHELAHQWWGQAVGWKNYHEQWLSEGLAQYFAALYAERLHGKEVFAGIVRRLQEWAVKKSDEGPVYLGYRIGHVKRDPQLFRAIVYNKSAAVLHMLRRLLGDDVFFRGLRRFYHQWRFRKAGSDDLRVAMEAESGRSLTRFFERWIYDSKLPQLGFSSRVEQEGGRDVAVLRFTQIGDLFDVPVTVTLHYVDRPASDIVVPVTEALTEMRVPLEGRLGRIEVNRDKAAVAKIVK